MTRSLATASQKPQPVSFDEDLAYRSFPQRYRRVGSPFEYLDSIGIAPIVEYIVKGHLLVDVAEATDVPFVVLQDWVKQSDYTQLIDEAQVCSAEGMLAEGMRGLRTARTDFELKRANSIVKHAQYMAEKKNRPVYGQAANAAPHSPITYVFNVGNTHEAQTLAHKVIEHEAARAQEIQERMAEQAAPNEPATVTFDFGMPPPFARADAETVRQRVGALLDLKHLESIEKDQPILIADRPANPTPAQPDIGPFFEPEDN